MTARVWIPVQDDKAVLASIDEQALLIRRTFGGRAEDTPVCFVLRFHVSGSPRRPQVGHIGQEGLRKWANLLQLRAQGPDRCSGIHSRRRPLFQIGLPYPVIPCSA